MSSHPITRRTLIGALAASALAAPSVVRAQELTPDVRGADPDVRRNSSSLVTQRWQVHFEPQGRVTILADTGSRALH